MDLDPERPERVRNAALETQGRRRIYNLERAQRISLDIDEQPMDFTAETVADMLYVIAAECEAPNRSLIYSVANALLGIDPHHVLILKQKKKGKFLPPDEMEFLHWRRISWLQNLAKLEREGLGTEAAVAQIAETWGASRATIFAEVAKAEEFYSIGAKLDKGGEHFVNPRPAKSRNG
ncbi:hypothetical protein [Sphingomonas sp. 35-24ZXX]|uniref:hypothetical protein n=1 Tax=Sphingomonas sp. 35-24ZXX TaxID=1545915 RepID=UPI0012E01E03|nr:hypothetical protein [Sphingomonas sp. 35-24ZXX]